MVRQASCLMVVAMLLPVLTLVWVPAAAAKDAVDEQLEFGIKMARRGLWNEALFRFSRVLGQRPGDVRLLNNVAVAYEAIGEFDLALEHYQRALQGDSSNRELRRNYAQFVEFYESLRPKTEEGEVGEAAAESTEASTGAAAEAASETEEENDGNDGSP